MKRLTWIFLGATLPAVAQTPVDFNESIAPLIKETCIRCHGPEKVKGGLRLDTKEATFKGGKNGPVIVAGNAADSELYKRIILPESDGDVMPNDGKPLTKEQTDLFKAWINAGAAWPDGVNLAGAAESQPAAATANNAPAGSTRPSAPDPVLPDNFTPLAAEAGAIAEIAKAGVDVRPLAQNSPWREANFGLQGDKVTDSVIQPLGSIQSLVDLNLARTKVTDSGLAVLGRLPYLTSLHLELTTVSDAGLSHLKGLSNLVYLNLYGTQVTDAGLAQLNGLPHLKRLYVWQSKVTPEGARKFMADNPWVEVNTGWDPAALAEAAKPEEKKEEGKEKAEKKE